MSRYFRGRRIIDAVFNDLKANLNFNAATELLLTGCSAGGLSTYLHADYVASLLPLSVTKYGAAPISGYFLDHPNTEGTPVYADQMQVKCTTSTYTASSLHRKAN